MMTPEYVLSLDFDGVLHPFGSRGGALFKKLPLIYKLLDQCPTVRVLVHSSWRFQHDAAELGKMLFCDRPDLANRYIGVTPVEVMSRWESIDAWVGQHKPKSTCVLDDEPRMFPKYIVENRAPHICFIECPTSDGLAENHPALDIWARSTLTESA